MKILTVVAFIQFLFLLFIVCQGFNLNFEVNTLTSENNVACQVICEETFPTPRTSGDTLLTENNNLNIKRMSIFSATQTGKSFKAEISTGKQIVTKAEETFAVDGLLTGKQARLRLDVFNIAECQAQYICQLIMTDDQVKELTIGQYDDKRDINSYRSADSENNNHYEELSDLTKQLLNRVESLDSVWTTRADSMKDILEEKITKDDLTALITSLSLELSNVAQRLDNKISDVEDNVQMKTELEFLRFGDKLKSTAGLTNDATPYLESCDDSVLNNRIDNVSIDISVIHKNISDLSNMLGDTMAEVKNIISNDLIVKLDDAIDSALPIAQNCEKSLGKFKDTIQKQIDSNSDSVFEQIKTELNASYCSREYIQSILKPTKCEEGLLAIPPSSSYPYPVITPDDDSDINIPHLCDTLTQNGGWIIMQRRSTGKTNFYRGWEDYKRGFGSIKDDFWIGLEMIHKLTSNAGFELRVDVEYQGKSAYALYSSFSVGPETDQYRLHVGAYSGTAGDSLTKYHNGMAFSTKDKDNDHWGKNCASHFTGAWWYNGKKICHTSNLNGAWQQEFHQGLSWNTIINGPSVSFSEMKIRRLSA